MSVGVNFGGITFFMDGTPDAQGDRFYVSDIEGLDSADIEYSRLDKYGDGGTVNYSRLPKRELNIKGWAVGNQANPDVVWRVRQKLEAWCGYFTGRSDYMYVVPPPPGISVQMIVQRSGRLHLPPPRGDKLQEFDVTFTAEDPRKYAQSAQQVDPGVNGTATLTNNGNYPTFLFATLMSPGTNPWLQNNSLGNARLTLAGSIPANSTVDFLNKLTFDNTGVRREYAVRPRSWFWLQPGSNTIQTFGTWRLVFRDAWV